ncbi:MAG TPA: cobyrinate a,c-diamide synthase [Solirubrobacteraceae bacterium]|nr:cobyrinate a,c-diamide synthase [Solirubrobacteraceae bacterium]
MIPRIVVAGAASGAGKTTVASGLIGALRAGGLTVQGFKVGPDYIDPSYHALASGRPGRNLDAFLSGTDLIAPLVRHGGTGADIAVIEGVMGMFDGTSPNSELASTAQIAKLLAAPVVLVLDASAMARSAAAVLHGFASFDPEVNVAGVIFNRIGSDGHAQLLREAVAPLGIPVLGALRSDERIAAPERHLGLVPVGERARRAAETLAALAEAIAHEVDLAAIERLARSAPAVSGPAWSPTPVERQATARVAIARGPAFSFHYEENLELLAAAGAELAPFDPMTDAGLPPGSGALILAGGFPEVFGPALAANVPLRKQVRELALAGRPILAECGGLLYLLESLDGDAMCDVLPGRGEMAGRLTIGYREARAATATPWLAAETEVRGHEFHHALVQAAGAPAWELSAGGITRTEGIVAGSVQASFLHVHWAAYPEIAGRFVRTATA